MAFTFVHLSEGSKPFFVLSTLPYVTFINNNSTHFPFVFRGIIYLTLCYLTRLLSRPNCAIPTQTSDLSGTTAIMELNTE